MPDDIQVGGDWFHPLYRSKFKRVATAHADSYRRKGHMARIRRVKDFDNYHKRGHIWMYARTTRDPEVRAIMQKHGARNITREKDYGDLNTYWVYLFDALG